MVKAVDIYHEWNLVYISLMVKNDSYLFKLDFWMLAKGKKMHLPIKECGSDVALFIHFMSKSWTPSWFY